MAIVVLLLCAVGSALFTALAVDYGRRRGLIDLPGQRRSHTAPTPRGGGVGIVASVGVVLAALAVRGQLPLLPALGLAGALLLVAAVGWWDDHHPLPPRLRLVVHAAAAAGFLLCLPMELPVLPALALFAVLVFALVAAINVCNFMDGINGIAASQAGLIAAGLAIAFVDAGSPGWGLLAAALAAACAGFLPFNLPRARIFLGDVGSGALGLLVGVLLLVAWLRGALPLPALLLLPSAFALDAGLTLLGRMRAGKRWTRPHREHLYQWLVRSGASHLAVTAAYAGWTALMLALAALPQRQPALGWSLLLLVYAGGALLWRQARQRLLASLRERGRQ
jgi:UDP-N-acetylmuramyl pentapeptide phosphotransferase/UDP-N-acetylglucosamine-1-phosphate transferase